MSQNQFKLFNISPLIGSSLSNFVRTLKNRKIDRSFHLKVFLSFLIVLVTTPFRWYEKAYFSFNIKSIPQPEPVFILGHWRSGTTFLHNLICQDPKVSYVSTYQSVFPNFMASKWLFQPLMKLTMPNHRPGDNMKLAVDLPQEEEFALSNTGPISYYNFFYFPKMYGEYYQKCIRLDGQSNRSITRFNDAYNLLLKKACLPIGSSRIVIKNPANTGRIDWLLKNYPQAKFIHIHRNPYEVYVSTKKFYTQLIPTLWFHRVSPDFIQEMIIETYVKLYSDYLNQCTRIPAENLIEISYEDFEKTPVDSLQTIYSHLRLPGFEKARNLFVDYADSQRTFKKTQHTITSKEARTIDERWSKFIKLWNYDFPKNISLSE